MPAPQILLVAALVAGLYLGGGKVWQGTKYAASHVKRGVVKVVTLGHKK